MPVFVNDKLIQNGKGMVLLDRQNISLCEEDMSVATEYEFQIYA
jgi:hypothetical protein